LEIMMKLNTMWKLGSMAVGAVLVASVTLADPPKPAEKPATDKQAAAADQGQVVEWSRKATKSLPKNRTGGSLTDKSIGGTDASLFFIAPRSTGLTTQELPDVYWYVSAPTKNVTFTLLRADQKNKTLLRLALKDVQPGFHKIELAKVAGAHNLKPLEANDWTAGQGQDAPRLKALYRMALRGEEPKLLATAYIARVKAAPGANPNDYALQIRNELWYDAVESLADQLGDRAGAKRPAPREQFGQMLRAEEVLQSDVADNAPADERAKARAEEEKVIHRLSVPDPIDLQSDTWEARSVPDPIDLQSVPDPIDLK
jgi:hypothetical protein